MSAPRSEDGAPSEEPNAGVEGERGGILLDVAYDGSSYRGFAIQDNAVTVAGVLREALRTLDPSIETLRVASRTDAGVHARTQRVSFDVARPIPPRAWVLGLIRHLPDAIAVRRASRVRARFEPRFETAHKRYRYLLSTRRLPDPFLARRVWRLWGLASPDAVAALETELAVVEGTHDFSGFASARDERDNRVRTLGRPRVTLLDDALIAIDLEGDGFLHNMVRILVGTAADVALGRLPRGTMRQALETRDRRRAGVTAPPDGLYLEALRLHDEGTDPWPPP